MPEECRSFPSLPHGLGRAEAAACTRSRVPRHSPPTPEARLADAGGRLWMGALACIRTTFAKCSRPDCRREHFANVVRMTFVDGPPVVGGGPRMHAFEYLPDQNCSSRDLFDQFNA